MRDDQRSELRGPPGAVGPFSLATILFGAVANAKPMACCGASMVDPGSATAVPVTTDANGNASVRATVWPGLPHRFLRDRWPISIPFRSCTEWVMSTAGPSRSPEIGWVRLIRVRT